MCAPMSDTRASGPLTALPVHWRILPVFGRALPVQVDALPVAAHFRFADGHFRSVSLKNPGQEACVCHAARIINANGLKKFPCFTKKSRFWPFSHVLVLPSQRALLSLQMIMYRTPQVRFPVFKLRNSRVLYKGTHFLKS
jgi:hypothetical protein